MDIGKLYELLESLENKIEEKVDKIIETQSDMRVDIAEIRKDINRNTGDMAHHIKRTDLLQDKVENNEERIYKLEEPKIFKKYLLKIVAAIGAIGGAIYGIIRLIEAFGSK